MIGRTVGQAERAVEEVSLLLIQRGHVLLPRPGMEMVLQEGDIVLIAGLDDAIDRFADN
jgi:uncharacterized protein with PhoU and TrkA domain